MFSLLLASYLVWSVKCEGLNLRFKIDILLVESSYQHKNWTLELAFKASTITLKDFARSTYGLNLFEELLTRLNILGIWYVLITSTCAYSYPTINLFKTPCLYSMQFCGMCILYMELDLFFKLGK
jgi:uncharacterized membrane protein (UPF0136 family)